MEFYKPLVPASVILLNENREVLLIRGRRGWEMPQGCVEGGEPIREAAVREVLEETGIHVELTRFCGVYHSLTRGLCNFLYRGRTVGGTLTFSWESPELGFFLLKEALKMITWGNFRERIVRTLETDDTQLPFLVEYHD